MKAENREKIRMLMLLTAGVLLMGAYDAYRLLRAVELSDQFMAKKLITCCRNSTQQTQLQNDQYRVFMIRNSQFVLMGKEMAFHSQWKPRQGK